MQGSLEWRENKLHTVFVSGTTIQAICNEHPFRNADDIFNELVGTKPHFLGNAFSREGQEMEPVIIKKYEEVIKKKVCVDQPMRILPGWPNIGVSPDGVVDNVNPIEIKYAPLRKIIPGKIPEYYRGQLQLTMAIFNVNEMDYVQMDASGHIDIVTVQRDISFLSNRLEIISTFIERVNLYRQEHPRWKLDYMRWEEVN